MPQDGDGEDLCSDAELEPTSSVGPIAAEPEEALTAEEEAELAEERRAAERRYFRVSRSLAASLLFVLPLLAVYELGILADVNAAAVWVKTPISWLRRHPIQILGANSTLIVNSVAMAVILVAVWRLGRRGALHAGTFLAMLMESIAYALLLGPLALLPLIGRWQFAGVPLHMHHFWAKLVTSCGAGLYEEFLFRLVLLGAVFFMTKELGRLKAVTAGAVALVASAVIFSVAHFLSPAENPDFSAFMYRLMAGIVLGLIFLTRGFGIAAWTHALYDIYVLCLVPPG